jgi:class 3 adenylate cyclase
MERLYTLLDRYLQAPAEALAAVEAEIWDRLGVEKVVLVLDMSGFSRLVRRFGIVHFLAMVRRMQMVTRPIVVAHGGENMKYEADNLFAVFDGVQAAARAAIEIVETFRTLNATTDDARDIHVSIGIDRGRVLLVPGKDMFGDAVNVASKLGEDLAGHDEILLSAAAAADLAVETGWRLEPRTYSVSGLTVEAVALFSAR